VIVEGDAVAVQNDRLRGETGLQLQSGADVDDRVAAGRRGDDGGHGRRAGGAGEHLRLRQTGEGAAKDTMNGPPTPPATVQTRPSH